MPFTCRLGILFLVGVLALGIGDSTSVAAESGFPVSVSVGTQSLTVPWHLGPVGNRFNPVLVAGTDRPLKPTGRFRLYYTVNVGLFQNYWWMSGVLLDSELGVRHVFRHGVHADLRLGVGYLHYFWRRKILELKDGVYVPVRDWGRPSVLIPLSIVLGYRGNPDDPLPYAPFVSAQWAAQAPFTEEAPAMTHLFLAIGVRMQLGRRAPTAGR